MNFILAIRNMVTNQTTYLPFEAEDQSGAFAFRAKYNRRLLGQFGKKFTTRFFEAKNQTQPS